MLKQSYTTKELAELICVAPKNLLSRAEQEAWDYTPRAKKLGGDLWLLNSMPESTQIAIRTSEERQIMEAQTDNALMPANPYLKISKDLLDDNRRYKALAKADLVRIYLEWQRKHGKTVAQKEAFILAYLGGAWPALLSEFGPKVSWKSLERWKLDQARAGSVLALADMRGIAHKGRTSLTEQHRIIILGKILNPNAPTISACARQIQKRCVAEGMYEPSEATIRRFVNAYTKECFDEWTLWREGKKAWNDKCAISLLRDWNLIEVGDVVIADGHTLNFETLNPDTGKPTRMTLLLFYDGASNHPLGWEIMATENTACISSAFRRTCLVLGKFPRVVYLDNGKAFRSKFFKGTPDFEQAGFLGLYHDLGCEVIHAWPYHGQSKPIERFFGTLHEMEMFVPSYTGNSIAAKPARMKRGEDLHRQLYAKMGGRPLTLEETHTAIASWFAEYSQRPQVRTHLQGLTPSEVFLAGVGPGVDRERLTLLMMQKEVRTISKDGISLFGRLYWHEALASRRHPVLVRYDDQLSPYTVLVYDTDGNFICEARDREHYKIAFGLHPAARVLGNFEEQQDLQEAIELKRSQENMAGASMKTMLENIVLPETQKAQAAIQQSQPTAKILPMRLKLESTPEATIAAIEAAKEKVRAEIDTKNSLKNEYTPASLMRFKDEQEKYHYLFELRYEQGIELLEQDFLWMRTFEKTPVFERNLKRRYEQLLELYEFRKNKASQAS